MARHCAITHDSEAMFLSKDQEPVNPWSRHWEHYIKNPGYIWVDLRDEDSDISSGHPNSQEMEGRAEDAANQGNQGSALADGNNE